MHSQPVFNAAFRRPWLLPLLSLLLITACTGREADVPLRLSVEHRFGTQPLVLDADLSFQDQAPVQVSRLSYYLGEFRLRDREGRWFESARRVTPSGDYVLIDVSAPASLSFEALSVPPGDYTALEFRVGVDAARNRAGVQTGALDPAAGMFWTWKTGYIFFALEGRSPASGADDHSLTYHLGGSDRASRTILLPLDPQPLHVRAERLASLQIQADLHSFFRGLALERTHTVMGSDETLDLADRYASMFRVDQGDGLAVVAQSP